MSDSPLKIHANQTVAAPFKPADLAAFIVNQGQLPACVARR